MPAFKMKTGNDMMSFFMTCHDMSASVYDFGNVRQLYVQAMASP